MLKIKLLNMKKTLALIPLIILSGCETISQSPNKVDKVEVTEYTSELNNLLLKMNEAAQVNFIESNKPYWQAYDPNYPDVSPVFYSRVDAEEYAYTNNFNRRNRISRHRICLFRKSRKITKR